MSESQSAVTAASLPGEVSATAEPQSQQEEPRKPTSSTFTLSIWPPTQRTRDAVVARLIETLSTPSILSRRYGTISQQEAEAAARSIEEEAFGAANAAVPAEDDGLEILQLYSQDISKRMLQTVKSRSSAGSMADNSASETASPAAPPPATEEAMVEVSKSVETEA